MRVLAGVAGALLVVTMLAEFFVSFLLPRRVKRDPRIARGLVRHGWRAWRIVGRRMSPATADVSTRS